MFLLTINLVYNNPIQARVFFIFLKNVLNQTSNAFNTTFRRQWNDRKSSYPARQDFAVFSNLIALYSGLKSVKILRVSKLAKEIRFEGVWDQLD